MGTGLRHLFLIGAVLLCRGAGNALAKETATPEFTEEVFLSQEKALKTVFPDSEKIIAEGHIFSAPEKQRIESRLGWSLAESSITVYQGYREEKFQGWAVIGEEIGKFKPITFIVKFDPDGKVDRVEVMIYREAVGSEVKRPRFLRQFRHKTGSDPLRINRDILNVTGATMSVQALTAGVKKAAVTIEEIYLRKK